MERIAFDPPDYSVVEGTAAAFRGFFPRKEQAQTPSGATDLMVPVAEGVEVGCRFYSCGLAAPTILYFHGNGEIVSDYDNLAPFYNRIGISLFVADYRGYGFSSGSPSFPTMLSDAHTIFHSLKEFLAANEFIGPLFVMGRSMGASSAVELAAHYPGALRGLIVESGSASVARMVEYLASVGRSSEASELERRHREKLRAISLPTLVIHGEQDELIALDRFLEFFNTLTMDRKFLEIIPGAGHNDIFWVGFQQYLSAILGFVVGASRFM